MVYIETPRLILRSWTDADLPSLRALCQDEDVMRYFLRRSTDAEVSVFYHAIATEMDEKGYGLWATELKDGGDFIGFVGLHEATFNADFTPCVEIGWRLHKAYWNKGYASEAAQACLAYAFHHLRLDEVYSFTSLPNVASQKVMLKIGMHHLRDFEHPMVPDGHPLRRHVLFVRRRE